MQISARCAHQSSFLGLTGPHGVTHQPGLDGLRGLAVAAVVAFHLGIGGVGGGYLGVSLFFTLSGLLIGTLVLDEIVTTGRFSLPGVLAPPGPAAAAAGAADARRRRRRAGRDARSRGDQPRRHRRQPASTSPTGTSSPTERPTPTCSAGRPPCCTSGAWRSRSSSISSSAGRRARRRAQPARPVRLVFVVAWRQPPLSFFVPIVDRRRASTASTTAATHVPAS